MCLLLIHYLAYTFDLVLGQTSIRDMVERVVVATSSSLSFFFFFFFFFFASTCRCSSGEPQVGEAGDAGETGDGGDVGEVGKGGERRRDGGVWLASTLPSTLSLVSGRAGAAGGSGFASSVFVRSSSRVGACFWACILRSY